MRLVATSADGTAERACYLLGDRQVRAYLPNVLHWIYFNLPVALRTARRSVRAVLPPPEGEELQILTDRLMSETGCFISDLHLLTSRSSAGRYLDAIYEAALRSRVFVFGGDIFDFHWAGVPIENAARDAAKWLREFAESCPHCQFHYLLGNHDHHEVFVERLVELDRDIANLAWDHHFLRLGDKAFLHGDVLGRNVTAESLTARRERLRHHRVRDAWEYQVYDLAVLAGLHKPVPYVAHPTHLVVRRILRYLRWAGHGPESGVRDVYFGHVHRVIMDYAYRGIHFHSGGAAIRGLPFEILEFRLESVRECA